ncbi:hypothetical protein QJS10_CPB04g00337 [Acorus calamus]|uniref:Uncharacterized protein n=1 Tax=Acorus calamus TaxID=4465 RepID=A0AAV9F100_ACOCL|nr:hypothetical protein QJS10_CPB04g00337 [Acorus calamus]
MVKHHLIHQQPRNGEEAKPISNAPSLETQQSIKPHHHDHHLLFMDYYCPNIRKSKPKLFRLFFLFVALCVFLSLAPRLLGFFYSIGADDFDIEGLFGANRSPTQCSSVANSTICCDRTGFRSDVCYMRGDVRTDSASASIVLHDPSMGNRSTQSDLIRPYTRKWETSVMSTIDELKLVSSGDSNRSRRCDVVHEVPAVVFSTGGYTGNVYHEFNDGIVPLFITSRQFNKKVVFVIVEYHSWWVTKYGDVVSRASRTTRLSISAATTGRIASRRRSSGFKSTTSSPWTRNGCARQPHEHSRLSRAPRRGVQAQSAITGSGRADPNPISGASASQETEADDHFAERVAGDHERERIGGIG